MVSNVRFIRSAVRMMATFFYFSDIFPTFRHFFRLSDFFGPSCHTLVPLLRPSEVLLFEGTYPPPTRSDGVRDEVRDDVT